jgi:hypothetical protein
MFAAGYVQRLWLASQEPRECVNRHIAAWRTVINVGFGLNDGLGIRTATCKAAAAALRLWEELINALCEFGIIHGAILEQRCAEIRQPDALN